jgi:hypothetical protein
LVDPVGLPERPWFKNLLYAPGTYTGYGVKTVPIVREGRTRVYLETSTRAQYEPTRAFYLRCGYQIVAELPDFYAAGDGKAIFLKVLPPMQ